MRPFSLLHSLLLGRDDPAAHPQYASTPHVLGGAAHSADTLANLNGKVSDATLLSEAASDAAYVSRDASAWAADDLLVVKDETAGVLTVERVAGAVPVVNFDAGADAGAARPSVPAGWTVIWRNVPSVPTNLGASDLWEDAA